MLRHFSISGLLTLATVFAVLIISGVPSALDILVLIAIEVAFSFDNAVVNAKVLERMSPVWQRAFLSIGVVIAIIGMRAIFPVLIVMLSAHLSWGQVIHEALHDSGAYARHLGAAHTSIAAFGGGFLLTLALYFLFDDERDELWLQRIERPLQRLGGKIWLPALVAAVVIMLTAGSSTHPGQILKLGLIGVAGYSLLKVFVDSFSKLEPGGHKVYVGKNALLAFIYLEILDASFSFDGVLGAFAITDKVILIALGLGIGALWVRSLTVYMVRQGTLKSYIYLEHGAHYAILILSLALLASLFITVPDFIPGVTGLGIIAASFMASREAQEDQESA